METFVAVVQEMLTAIAVKYNLKEKGLDPAVVPDIVHPGLRGGAERQAAARRVPLPADGLDLPGDAPEHAGAPAAGALSERLRPGSCSPSTPTRCTPRRPQAAQDTGLVSEELLHRSIRSNVELAEALAGLVRDMNLGLGTSSPTRSCCSCTGTSAGEARRPPSGASSRRRPACAPLVQGLGSRRPVVSAPHRPRGAAPPTRRDPAAPGRPRRRTLLPRGARHRARAARRPADLRRPADHRPRHPAPSCPPPTLHRALAETFEGLAGDLPPRSQSASAASASRSSSAAPTARSRRTS